MRLVLGHYLLLSSATYLDSTQSPVAVLLCRMGHYTDAPEDNLLGLTDKDALNEQEALGVATVERYLREELDYPVDLSVGLL
jgi:hypothetical protein